VHQLRLLHLVKEQIKANAAEMTFPFFAGIGDAYAMSFMAQARLAIDEPTVLTQIVTLVNELRLEQADPDTKGDMFEHVLRQIKQAGELGQFRTPRHIIRAIVDLIDPKIGETVYDPAACTAGFLVAPMSISGLPTHRLMAASLQNLKARLLGAAMAIGSIKPNGASSRPRPSTATTLTRKWSASPRSTSLCAVFPTCGF
jgi:N-6 DNA Methylase